MHPSIARHRTEISVICRRYRIRRLDVFGSAARIDDFDLTRSDVDFLVEFALDVGVDLDTFFGAKADLEQLLGRDVDLVEAGAIRNPFVLADIDRSRELVYAA
jgi:predicted nucleotidyltransferase